MFGPISVNATAPSTCPFAPFDRHTMWESGTCSRVVASHSRWDRKICAFHWVFSSETCSTLSTFFMKLGKSDSCVQRL